MIKSDIPNESYIESLSAKGNSRIIVVGSGYSAATVLNLLNNKKRIEVTWITRKDAKTPVYTRIKGKLLIICIIYS